MLCNTTEWIATHISVQNVVPIFIPHDSLQQQALTFGILLV